MNALPDTRADDEDDPPDISTNPLREAAKTALAILLGILAAMITILLFS